MSEPIADDVENDLRNGSERGRQAERHLREMPVSNTLNPAAQDFMGDLLDAQQRLISAQHQFLHNNDMAALARAQLDVITVQTGVMQRLGIFG
jgi:hypothetical protein